MRIALIDLGTASVRFEIYETVPGARPLTAQRCCREREMLKLGKDLYLTAKLRQENKEQARAVFAHLRSIISEYRPERICAVATCAFREAVDGPCFVNELEKILGAPIRIITGEEEAALLAKGILSNETGLPDEVVLSDIGGGSTELCLCAGGALMKPASLPLGAIRCQQVFLKSHPPHPEDLASFRAHVRSMLQAQCSAMRSPNLSLGVGSSGTVRTLAQLGLGSGQPCIIEAREVASFYFSLSGLALEEIRSLPGMEANRADMMLAGTGILCEIVDFFSLERLRVSVYSLRHGLLQQALESIAKQQTNSTAKSD